MNVARSGFPRSGFALSLVGAASLAAASLITACSQITQTDTIDFVYVACTRASGGQNYGEINVFEINSGSGKMRQIPSSPFQSQGRNPVAEAVSADYGSLFVVNRDDNTVVQFGIGTDGKLYPYNTVNTPGIFPLGIAVNKSDLFVIDLYQPLPICSDAEPCSGSIGVFPLTGPKGSTPVAIGSPVANPAVSGNYWPLSLAGAAASHIVVPTGVNVLASGAYVYVAAYDSSVTPSAGYVFGFAVGTNGALTPLPGSPFAAGVQPSAIASDASSTYVYVTDAGSGNVLGYKVASGALSQLAGSPYPAGNQPSSVVVDPSYPYVYVTNSLDANLTAYSMSNGALTRIGTYSTGLDPVAIGVDPSTNHFLFTANFLANNVSGFQLSTTAGTLLISQFSPFPSNENPAAVAAVPNPNGNGGGIHP